MMLKKAPEEIQSLLDEIGDIPTLPSIATAIMEKTLDSKVSAKQIAEMVERDQALSVKVLRVANSPFYRRIKEISTIRGAVMLLGFNVLKSIVLSISVINLFNEKNKCALDFYKFWQHSIACAVCAKSIAVKIFPSSAEDAFVAGLLHDLGKVIADQLICRKGEYREVLEVMNRATIDIIEVENDIVGVDHATLGKCLLEKWNLPAILSKVVGSHHNINELVDDEETRKLCAIIHVADIVTNHLGLGLGLPERGFVDPSLLSHLGLTSHDIQDISIALKDSISSISTEMGIPTAEPKTYFEVLQFANAQLGKLSLDLEQKKMALERRTLELSNLNQMSSRLQSSLKLSDILNVLTANTLTILEAKKARCVMRLSNLRIMITESFLLNGSPHTKSGIANTTKELLERSNAIYPQGITFIYAPLKVDGKIVGVIEAMPQDNTGQEETNQKLLLLRTIAEVGAQAIHRAMLITKNIKSQRLAAVSKTAIAANHEINSPLTTILLKLDMIIKEANISKPVANSLNEIKAEAIKIKNIVKKMLEISDVVETNYIKNEKMLDLHHASGAAKAPPAGGRDDLRQAPPEETTGFEEYLDDKPPPPKTSGTVKKEAAPGSASPGFEDYAQQQSREASKNASGGPGKTTTSDTPGFEDYLD
ncbi:MAG TPA: HDOD domain-containing protein [Deltaproteobacteria bacterium]|nr:HDOD domain-containing protein [Deltaproteobacteria bacterium]HQI00119.1 HDOD domain-containing protein [Deltaproteobacteria bacterium]